MGCNSGSSPRSTSPPSRTICWQAAARTCFGIIPPIAAGCAGLDPLEPAVRRGAVQKPGEPFGNLGQRTDAQRPADSLLGGQQVDGHGQAVSFDGGEKQGRPPRLGRSGGNLGRLQCRIDLIGHPAQLAGLAQLLQKIG